jgi:hypothetical protein
MKVAEQHHQYDIDFEAPAYDPDHRPNYVLLFGATGAALCILTLFSLVAALWRRVQAAARSTRYVMMPVSSGIQLLSAFEAYEIGCIEPGQIMYTCFSNTA